MPKLPPLEIRSCLFCGDPFRPKVRWQKYCKPQHSLAAYYLRQHPHPKIPPIPPADAKPSAPLLPASQDPAIDPNALKQQPLDLDDLDLLEGVEENPIEKWMRSEDK